MNAGIEIAVTSFAILGIYLAFQMVVLASLRQRLMGWRPAGPFNLRGLGLIVNIVALTYGVFAMVLLATPGTSGSFFADYVVLIGLGVVLVSGLLYLFIARPDSGSDAPEGDAKAVADEIRRRTGQIARFRQSPGFSLGIHPVSPCTRTISGSASEPSIHRKGMSQGPLDFGVTANRCPLARRSDRLVPICR